MGIEALYRGPRTSIPGRDAKIYPYVLDGLAIERPNQVWSSDLTYLPMAHGFLYLVAILDVASRKVLSFRVSNTMTPDFCVDALTEAIARYGAPEIVNRPGLAVHQQSVDRCARCRRRSHQHGWQGTLGASAT